MDESSRKNVFTLSKQITVKPFLIALLFVASLFAFTFIAYRTVYKNDVVFDMSVISFFDAHKTAVLIDWMRGFTFFGSTLFLLPAYIIMLAYLCIQRKFKVALAILILALCSRLSLGLLKQIFHRHRPVFPIIKDITTYSFPSAHALSSLVFCSILGYLVGKGNLPVFWKGVLIILLLLFSLTVGLSRVILNVHYATDVIAGFCLGVLWVIAAYCLVGTKEHSAIQDFL